MKTIEKDSLIPRYAQVKEILKGAIFEKYQVGDRIPSERQLTEIFGVSRLTVVRAIKELGHEGFLYSDHGRGTFVVASSNKETSKWHNQKGTIDIVIPLSAILEDTGEDMFVHKNEYLGIKKACEDIGFNIQIHDTGYSENGANLFNNVGEFAAIFVSNWNKIAQKMIPKLRSRGILWCGVGGNLEKIFPENCIFIDLEQGAELALKYLISSGYRKIGYCFWSDSISDGRMKTFKEFLSQKAIHGNEFLPIESSSGLSPLQEKQRAYKTAKERIKKGKLPEAFFCQNDLLASGVLEAAQEARMKIPDDLAIIGFDDRQESRESVPKLTTIKIPFEEMGRAAVNQVKRCFEEGKTSFQSMKIPCHLIIRNSCKGGEKNGKN